MTDDKDGGTEGETPDSGGVEQEGQVMRFASSVAETLQKARDGRPVAKVDAGTARLAQSFSGTRFALYPDRIKTPKGDHELTPSVRAEVSTAGGFKKKLDRRELYLTVEGDGWSISHQCDPRRGEKVRGFAAAVNTAVRALVVPPTAAQLPSDPSVPNVAEMIRQLAELRDAGVLDDAEFEAKKRELLSRM